MIEIILFFGICDIRNVQRWTQFNYIVTTAAGTINSVQNGTLLWAGTHKMFDSYGMLINPDVRIVHEVYEILLTHLFRIIIKLCALHRTVRASPVPT